MNAIAQSVSAETACEILHKALRPITTSWGLSGPIRSVGALFAACEYIRNIMVSRGCDSGWLADMAYLLVMTELTREGHQRDSNEQGDPVRDDQCHVPSCCKAGKSEHESARKIMK